MELGKKIILFTQFMLIIVSMMITSFATEKYINLHYTSTDTIMYIDYVDDIDERVREFTNTLRQFSSKYKVNFILRRYLSDQLTVLYASNIKDDARFSSYNNDLLKGNNFISNIDTSDQRQIGQLKEYTSDLELRVYDIAYIEFSGLENEIYIYGFHNNLMPQLVESLSNFGEIKIQDSSMTVAQLMNRSTVSSVLRIIPLVIMCLIFMFVAVSIIYVRGQSRLIGICRLAGKSTSEILFNIILVILRTGVIKVSIFALLLSVLVILTVRYEIVFNYSYVLLIAFMITISICMCMQIVIALIVIKGTNISDQFSKRSNNNINIAVLTVAKIIVVTVLIYSLANVYGNYGVYENLMSSMSSWIENKNIHRVIVSSEAVRYRQDLIEERYFNDRCSSFYDQLLIKNEAFIINSNNYLRVNNGKGEQYLYEQATFTRKDTLSPYGMSIIVDKAYLLNNTIISTENTNLYDILESDSNVLNVIVPSKFQYDELQIQNTFLEYFYFQKVTVDNFYNEAMGNPINEQKKSELKINIIYSKNNQNYFTYSSHSGDVNGNIQDPIAIVYNPSVDTSNIMSLLTSSVYFVSDSKDAAYFDIFSSVKETGVKEVKSTRSVFSEVGKFVNNTKANIVVNFVLLVISVIAFLSVIVQYTLLFYNINKKKITIKYLLGSGLMQFNLNAHIIISNILVLGFSHRIMKNPNMLYVLLVLTLIEVYTVNLLCRYNTEKNAGSIVKG